MNTDTLLLRQIHPSFIQGDRPSSQAFNPTPKDEKKLSVYDGDMINPERTILGIAKHLDQQGVRPKFIDEFFLVNKSIKDVE